MITNMCTNLCTHSFTYILEDVEVRVGHYEVNKTEQSLISRNGFCGNYTGPGSDGQGSDGEFIVIDCIAAIEGKYVTIQILDDRVTSIELSEVEIFGNEIVAGNKSYSFLKNEPSK